MEFLYYLCKVNKQTKFVGTKKKAAAVLATYQSCKGKYSD